MYFSISHYPEVTNHSDKKRVLKLAKPYLSTPSAIYFIHCIVLIALLVIDLPQLLELPTVFLKVGLAFTYLLGMYLTGINTWQRKQFLSHLDEITTKSEQSDIALAQSTLFNHWQHVQVTKIFIISAPTYANLKTYEFGYLSLSEKGEKAMIRVLEQEGLAAGQLKIAILNDQVIPAVIEENTQVILTLAEMPITGTVSKINLVKQRKYTVNKLDIDFIEKVLVVEFEQLPEELPHSPSVSNTQTGLSYKLKLIAIDKQNFVIYKVIADHPDRPLMSADIITFDNNATARVLGFSQLAPHQSSYYPLTGGEIG